MDTQNPAPPTTPSPEVSATPTPQPVSPTPQAMPEHQGHGKKVFLIVFVIALIVIGLSIFSLYMFNKSQAIPNDTMKQAEVMPSATPTMTPSPTPANDESALDSLDTGNPDSDLQDLQKDVSQL